MASLSDRMDSMNDTLWSKADGWSNGGIFANSWNANQISFANGQMVIALETVNGQLQSGEYRTNEQYGYGYYESRIKASGTAGTINGFFTYTGPSEGTQHDEIDIEIKGDDPTKIQFNYWTDGIEHPTVFNLGFDASDAFHTYGFLWSPDKIEWYIDGKLIHSEDGARGVLPTLPGKLIANLWGTSGAGAWSSDYTSVNGNAHMFVDSVRYYSNTVGTTLEDSGSILITQTQLLSNSAVLNGSTVSVTNISASEGTITDNGNNTWTLVPPTNYNGTIALNYNITDGKTYVATTAIQIITAVNDAPSFISGSQGSVAENAPLSTVVYTAKSADPDSGTVLEYELSGDDASLLNIDHIGGEVTLKASADYESKRSYNFNITVSDGELSATQAVVVNVTDVYEYIINTTTLTHLNSYGVTVQQAQDFILANLSNPSAIYSACEQYHVTNQMIVEIFDNLYSIDTVKGYFSFNGLNPEALDLFV